MRDLWYETYLDLDQLTDTGVSTTGLGDLAFPHLTSSHVTFPTPPITSTTPSPPISSLAPYKFSPASPEAPGNIGSITGVDVTQESPLAPDETPAAPPSSFTPPHSHAHNMLVLQPQCGATEC
ncbi:proline-rich receptor-like protein kinase PERK1 [Penaeus japonicus]|uniref:proline-rich receptor-like protein kinase PERK1 n=1 Tax=Penaeus japonicus TaxID=27405 RepID=UPI001C712D3B|nr:proline-rich receptor-like protein kinase PERK1 [Penaeus japonicus]